VESGVGRGTFVADLRANAATEGTFEQELSPATERLLRFERARPRFGTGERAVPMHALIPDPNYYPSDEFRKVLNRVMQRGGPDLLLYGDPQGDPRMREVLAGRLREASIDVSSEEILLCHGASQGISLALRLYTESGDTVACEEPTYNNVLATSCSLGLRTAPVPMRENGLDLMLLDRVLSRPEVKLLYTIPTYHNPMGTTSTTSHRRSLLEIAARHGKPVVEDGYEMDLAIDASPPPPLAALDASGLVLHLSSFSKSLFPGLRVGGIAARGRAVDGLLALKRATDHSDSMPLQAALAEFVAGGGYDRHLTRLRRDLRTRRDAVLSALGEYMPDGTRWTTPAGGYQVWVELPFEIDTGELLADAVGAGVLFSPGSQFNHDGRASRCLRLTFAMANADNLRRGVEALAGVVSARQETAYSPSPRVHI